LIENVNKTGILKDDFEKDLFLNNQNELSLEKFKSSFKHLTELMLQINRENENKDKNFLDLNTRIINIIEELKNEIEEMTIQCQNFEKNDRGKLTDLMTLKNLLNMNKKGISSYNKEKDELKDQYIKLKNNLNSDHFKMPTTSFLSKCKNSIDNCNKLNNSKATMINKNKKVI